jgi:hypothetical protein
VKSSESTARLESTKELAQGNWTYECRNPQLQSSGTKLSKFGRFGHREINSQKGYGPEYGIHLNNTV